MAKGYAMSGWGNDGEPRDRDWEDYLDDETAIGAREREGYQRFVAYGLDADGGMRRSEGTSTMAPDDPEPEDLPDSPPPGWPTDDDY